MITLSGASDDLIELDGAISEEFSATDGRNLVVFSDGTILAIELNRSGVWRINPVVIGSATLRFTPAPEDDDRNYSDRAEIIGDVHWAAHASAWAATK